MSEMSEIIWGERSPGSCVSRSGDMVIIADVPDWIRLPSELEGGVMLTDSGRAQAWGFGLPRGPKLDLDAWVAGDDRYLDPRVEQTFETAWQRIWTDTFQVSERKRRAIRRVLQSHRVSRCRPAERSCLV